MMRARASQKILMIGSAWPPFPSKAMKKWPNVSRICTEHHGLALTEELVGQIAAHHRSDVNQRGIGTVDDGGFAIGEEPVLDQVEDQQGAHAVIGETLPHFGHEQQEQSLGMSDDLVRARDEHHPSDKKRCQCDYGNSECPHFERRAECEEHAFDHMNRCPSKYSDSRPSLGAALP